MTVEQAAAGVRAPSLSARVLRCCSHGLFLLKSFVPLLSCGLVWMQGRPPQQGRRVPAAGLFTTAIGSLPEEGPAATCKRALLQSSPLLVQVAYNPGVMLPYSKLGEEHEVTVQDASQLAAEGEELSYWQLMVSRAALVSGQPMASSGAQPRLCCCCCWPLCRPSTWQGHELPL